LVPMLTIKGK